MKTRLNALIGLFAVVLLCLLSINLNAQCLPNPNCPWQGPLSITHTLGFDINPDPSIEEIVNCDVTIKASYRCCGTSPEICISEIIPADPNCLIGWNMADQSIWSQLEFKVFQYLESHGGGGLAPGGGCFVCGEGGLPPCSTGSQRIIKIYHMPCFYWQPNPTMTAPYAGSFMPCSGNENTCTAILEICCLPNGEPNYATINHIGGNSILCTTNPYYFGNPSVIGPCFSSCW